MLRSRFYLGGSNDFDGQAVVPILEAALRVVPAGPDAGPEWVSVTASVRVVALVILGETGCRLVGPGHRLSDEEDALAFLDLQL